jgi:hypothetical protein
MIDRIRNLLLLGLPVAIACSCDEPVNKEEPLEKFAWLEGEWYGTDGEEVMQEKWKKVNDDLFTAHSFILVGTDTVFQEYVKLQDVNDTVYYVVFIHGVPDSTSFMLTKYEKDEAVFQNPDHDFPQTIVYRRAGDDSLYASIEGLVAGKTRREDFPYRRTSPPPKIEKEKEKK